MCPTHIRELKVKKNIILLVISFCAISLQAQNCDSIAKSIVEKIKNYSPDDLLPYYDKGQGWGLMSKNGKILTSTLGLGVDEIVFNSNAHFYYDDCEIIITGKDYSFEKKKTYTSIVIEEGEDVYINRHIKGFEVKREINTLENKIDYLVREYSNQYERVFSPFEYNEKWYAYAKLVGNDKLGIIDREGNIIIDFKYKSLNFIESYKDKSQCWFYFETENGERGFINTEGQTKLYGKLLSYVGGYTYSLQKNNEKSGILDLRTLEWTIKPQKKLKFENVISIGQNTENMIYYVVVSKADDKYVIDMQKKAYRPIH